MKQYIVDAFTKELFKGNPAAVCVLDDYLSDELLLSITKENNLSETAFAVRKDTGHYQLRWFTPGGEIDLCGHATLATAFVLSQFYEINRTEFTFETLSGELIVAKNNDLFEMIFPSYDLESLLITQEITDTLGLTPREVYLGRDLVCILENEEQVRKIQIDFLKAKELDGLLLHVTALGKDFDCVSRSFAPKLQVEEDPVCGSGHCHIVPLWAKKLEKNEITAYQASERSGILYGEYLGEKTKLSGYATLFSTSDLAL